MKAVVVRRPELSEVDVEYCRACGRRQAAVSVAAMLPGGVVEKMPGHTLDTKTDWSDHPSGIITILPHLDRTCGMPRVDGVAVERTARRIMEGTLYIRE